MLHNFLIYRLITLNIIGAAFVAYLGFTGAITKVFDSSHTYVLALLSFLFVVSLISLFRHAIPLNSLINAKRKGTGYADPNWDIGIYRAKAGHISMIAQWLVTITLIGNFFGLMIGLGDFRVDTIASPQGILALATALLIGMKIAFSTSVVGLSIGLWIEVNKQILDTAAILYVREQPHVRN